jgi:hypothetical protein
MKKLKNIMIGNVPELVEAARREIVVGEVATAALEFLVGAPFAIQVAMQLVSKVLICVR